MANSPADRQVDAHDQVEALAQALYGVEKEIMEENRRAMTNARFVKASWALAHETKRAFMREFARRMLVKDLVRPGKRLPERPPPQIEGQQQLLDDTPFEEPEGEAIS